MFSHGVCNVKMKEELAIHKDMCTSLELFNLATKCARAEEEGMRCPAGDPREADPSKPPREAGPASDPCEVGHATPGEGLGRPVVLHLFLLLGRSPGHCAWSVDRCVLLEWL